MSVLHVLGTCVRKLRRGWTCVWACTRAPFWAESWDRSAGSLTSGPLTLPWQTRWSRGASQGEMNHVVMMDCVCISCVNVCLQVMCVLTGVCTSLKTQRTVCTKDCSSWSLAREETAAIIWWRKALTPIWYSCPKKNIKQMEWAMVRWVSRVSITFTVWFVFWRLTVCLSPSHKTVFSWSTPQKLPAATHH